MNHKKELTLSRFFHSCPKKSTSLYQDFIFILTERRKKNHAALVSGQELLSKEDQELLKTWVEKKGEDYPIQYFVNSVAFCDLKFYVEEGALIPRMETEEMVFFALKKVKERKIKVKNLLDIGAGSGCIGISAAHQLKNLQSIVLIEPSKEALKSLNHNVDSYSLKRIKVLNEPFESIDLKEKFDLILSNPPYIKLGDKNVHSSVYKYEPHAALYSGKDPIKLIVHWVNKAYELLCDKGLMVFEFSHDQKYDLQKKLSHFNPQFYKDSFRKDRFFSILKTEV